MKRKKRNRGRKSEVKGQKKQAGTDAPPSDLRPLTSARQLANAVGVTHTAVNEWLADDRWPFGRGPWSADQLDAIRRWRARELREDPAKLEPSDEPQASDEDAKVRRLKRLAEAKLKAAQAKGKTLENEIKEKLYHRVDECQRNMLRKIHAVKQDFGGMPERAPFEQTVKDWIRTEVDRICNGFAQGNG